MQTRRITDSAQAVGSGAPEPIRGEASETDWLPSASLRWRPPPGWQGRAAASRTITRPDFNQLSPSLLLLPNPIDPNLNQGSAGNPALQPMRSTNLDLGLEHERAGGTAVSLVLFWKQVDGFVFNLAQPEEQGGAVYLVSRPRNADRARVRGVELAWQGFFDTLPGAWSGLGLQANVTHVDSSTFDRVLGREVALQGLSRHSANLIGLYEHGRWSARLARRLAALARHAPGDLGAGRREPDPHPAPQRPGQCGPSARRLRQRPAAGHQPERAVLIGSAVPRESATVVRDSVALQWVT